MNINSNNTSLKNKQFVPILVTRDIVIFPNCEFKLEIGREHSLFALDAALKNKLEKHIIVVSQKFLSEETPKTKDIFKIGTLCTFKIKNETSNPRIISIVLKGKERVTLEGLKFQKYYKARFSSIEFDVEKLKSEKPIVYEKLTRMLFVKLSDIFEIYGLLGVDHLNKVKTYFENKETEKVIFTLACHLPFLENKKRQTILECASFREMVTIFLEDVNKASSETKTNETKKNKTSASYMAYSTKKLMDKILKKIESNPYPKEVKNVIREEIRNYTLLPPGSSEANVLRTYIEVVHDLPWYEESKESEDLVKVRKILDEDHYDLEEVKKRILWHIAVSKWTKQPQQEIMCLVGPSGTGKTSIAMSIARALGRPYVKIPLNGTRDVHKIKGHLRTYVGSMFGEVLRAMKKAKVINPVILLDEIDKISTEHYSDPSSALLEALDPDQNKYFLDDYLKIPYSLSKVFFICTANEFSNIPAPLQDRMKVILIDPYTEYEKIQIAENFLIPKVLKSCSLSIEELQFTKEAILELIRYYIWDSLRELRRLIKDIASEFILRKLDKNIKKEIITKEKVKSYLGERIYKYFTRLKPVTGVVTGLAYTSKDGDVMQIEVDDSKGSGKLILTGKLGDVMKESIAIALSYIKANTSYFGIENYQFDKRDLHIHLPEGAISKEGPSAGVTIVTAILSFIKKVVISRDVGMTGEISLKGDILPVGGLVKKCISAERAKLKTIILPYRNKDDRELKKIPLKIRKCFKFCENYKQIYDSLFQ